MSRGRDWNEETLSESPAVDHLGRLGWTYVPPDILDAERESLKQVVLVKRLSDALKTLNPWLSDDNVHKAVRAVTGVQSTSLIEASEKLHTTLTYGIALEEDLGDGKKNHPVRFFDFDDPRQNDFLVTRQFRVHSAKKNIRTDVMLFVNGIPLGIIECKSPTLGEAWKLEALDQFSRYQEMEDRYRELGTPKLFETIQVLIATCGQAAVYGTVLTPHRFFIEWKTPHPKSTDDLARDLGRKPSSQEVLFEGMLTPANFLDLVRNFVVFERDAKTGKTVRKLCRYQQFAAVNKAIARARTAKGPMDRGGVVWHTQGSGKSLTMLWLALKLRRDPRHENPTLVSVTDRKDLDEQIAKTFVACGFHNPDQAESVRDLRDLLSGPSGKTILTTVQKFQEIEGSGDGSKRRVREEYPLLSPARNIFVLADEAHRTQYGGLAANLRKALPNACFFGFSGTPIDKKDRSTLQTFGPYIDTYTIEQAVLDGATVPIYYEGRLAELRIVGNTLDAIFDRVFADRTDEEREAIKKKFGKEASVAGTPKRVETIALDLIDHYTKFIAPNGFKGQVVAVNRETAVLYKEALDRLQGPQSAVIISKSNDDDQRLVPHHKSEEERKKLIAQFCTPGDPLSILVVCDMLLTGFDAPVEQVMYLDAPLREHTLLQAIARVNRVFDDKKTYGLIVDYWGVSEALQEALAIFAPSEVKGAMTPKGDELPRLQARHAAALRFFVRIKDKDDLGNCVAVLEPEDVRADFDLAFKRFAESLDMILPDARGLPYVSDARWLGKIRATASATYRDGKIDISDCGAKVRRLIEEAVIAEGIQILVKQVSLFTPEFEEKLKALRTDEARASEMEHAIKNEIHVKLEEDPAFYTSLRERLEKLIEDRKAKRLDAAQQLKLFEQLRGELRGHTEAAESLGMTETSFAIYGLIADARPAPLAESKGAPYGPRVDESKKELSAILEEQLESQVTIVRSQTGGAAITGPVSGMVSMPTSNRADVLVRVSDAIHRNNLDAARGNAIRRGLRMTNLLLKDFAHIAEASITFGDLTVLVGAQGTGKSLALQWLKTALDGKQMVGELREAGQDVTQPDALIDLIFGVGMGDAWTDHTAVVFENKQIRPKTIGKLGNGTERVFFIPAHRAMLISDGWAAPFQKLTAETPVVARLFSQNLFDRFSAREGDKLFPLDRVLKKEYRDLIDAAVFHGGKVGLEQDKQHAKRLKLTHGSAQLPFMTWTAGQREFTPLLLGLYHLLPPRKILKQSEIDWVVVEEPEMGLHPQAVSVFMLLVLDLLWRGYRVVLSTHSPLVLTVVWMLRRLRETNARWQLVCEAFDVRDPIALKKVAQAALTKTVRAHLLFFGDDGKVRSKDISTLDPGAEDNDVSGWGGLTGFSSRFGDAVRQAVNEGRSR